MLDERIDVPLPFPRHSALRLVMRERIVQFSGLRALLLQGLDPVMVAGFLEHTDAFHVPEATGIRLIRTGLQMNRIYFSDDVDEIQRLCAGLRRGHSYVHGTLPESAGELAGTPYAADAPEALLWVIATLADSAWDFYARWHGGDGTLREAFWREFRIVGRLFGLAESEMPTDWDGLSTYIARTGPTLTPLPEAIVTARGILGNLGLPGALRLTEPIIQAATIDSLPGYARDAYGLDWDSLRSLSYRSGARGAKLWGGMVPRSLRFTPEWGGVFPEMPASPVRS